ncbi:MAG: hypothetical protein WBD20_22145 [Pirellulaceae bacterium]
MRYRDVCCIAIVMLLVIAASTRARQTFRNASFASVEINREDANRESSTILSTDQWVEYQIQTEANSIRLLTNVALHRQDAPDHDLDNPRTGWRYAVDYELLDANRNVLRQATYHFRSQVHQLLDVASGDPIYPIFFGKSSLVATQTRAMQLPINQDETRASILRVRVAHADPKIEEVVSRVLVRSEREDYDQRTTWNRMSMSRREGLSRFCVYDHDLLTIGERNNLLRWQWKSAPVISDFKKRYLFFIGDIDDQQVRGDQVPAGLYIDQDWLGTLPIPEKSDHVRLEFRWLSPIAEDAPATASLQWTGADVNHATHTMHQATQDFSEMKLAVDGGLVQITANRAVVVRAFVDSSDVPIEIMKSQNAGPEFEITPDMNYVRTFLSDSRSVQYGVTHLDDSVTPFRLVVRYPHAPLFSNLGESIGDSGVTLTDQQNIQARWEFVRRDGSVAQSGLLNIANNQSLYDRFTVAGKREPISDPSEFFLAVPSDVERVRITSDNARVLVSAYVRPSKMPSVTQVPEDYHAFCRITSTRRTWYAMNPIDCDAMIQENRSFIVQAQSRPAEPNEEILAGRYEWERFVPAGNWVGRQLLVPRNVDMQVGKNTAERSNVRDSAIDATFYELNRGQNYSFSVHENQLFADAVTPSITFVSDDHPGQVKVLVNGKVVHEQQLRSQRGELFLKDIDLAASGTIQVESDNQARFFFAGTAIDQARMYLRRSAQRLKDGELSFQYVKTTSDDEMVTLQLFRPASDSQRCRIDVKIDEAHATSIATVDQTLKPSWTVRHRQYDLRPQAGHDSVLLGHHEQVDAGYRCFIGLGSDLPPGTYRITVRRADEVADGYALLYKIVPGQRPDRAVSIHSTSGDDDGA